jgi:HD superfamily phosphohydrolase
MINEYTLRDPLYGIIKLSSNSIKIIKEPAFTRLKNIRQLGTLDIVFPGASHSRYEHSLGVAHLARITALNLLKKHPNIINYHHVICIELAGLLHDIGHFAYSHVFDNFLKRLHLSEKTKTLINHENRSEVLIHYILKKHKYSNSDIDIIKYLVNPINNNNISLDIPIPLRYLINNIYHGMDVDKMDYLLRDSMYLKQPFTWNHNDIINLLKRTMIVDNCTMFEARDHGIIYDLACHRILLHSSRYSHPNTCATSYMVQEIISELNKTEHFDIICELDTNLKIETYIKFDDSILESAMNSKSKKLRKLCNDLLVDKKWYLYLGDYNDKSELGESFIQMKWNLYNDISSPLNLIPKVRYHLEGTEVKANSTIYRIFKKL